MKSFVRNLPDSAEFCLVLFVGLGSMIGCQIWQFFQSERGVTNSKLVELDIVELVALAAVLWFGHIRGWSLEKFGFKISWKGTGCGILLFVVATSIMAGVGLLLHIIHPVQSHVAAVVRVSATGLTLPFILLHSIINPVFEEFLAASYLITSLQRFGMWPAVLASALFRMLYHFWLGAGVLSIFAFGVIFGFTYWRWRQLWPLIVAHSLCDIYGLLQLVHRAN